MTFYPEGTKHELCTGVPGYDEIFLAIQQGTIFESRALVCDSEKNLHFKIGDYNAVMPRENCAMSTGGTEVRDIAILSRVGLRTCFVIEEAREQVLVLSRKKAQQQCERHYVSGLVPGDVIFARITHIESFGAFCDIGCGIMALLPIDSMSVSRINSPKDRFAQGQQIYCVVKDVDEKKRLILSTKELFGTWLENAMHFSVGETVLGTVRSIESYGVFVELAPNLAGLAENTAGVICGQTVSVYIKSIQPEKMKIKLNILHGIDYKLPLYNNFSQTCGHISSWVYSTPQSNKTVQTMFD